MFLRTPQEVCSEGIPNELSAEKQFKVAGNDAKTVTYVVIGVETGEWPIRVVIVTTSGSDGVEKKLNVVVSCTFLFLFVWMSLNILARMWVDCTHIIR